jgi:hypothetical protein
MTPHATKRGRIEFHEAKKNDAFYVTLDLQGFRSGSLNDSLQLLGQQKKPTSEL